MNRIKEDIIIVGAGLTGLFLAQLLERKGKSCLILEKSSGVGGRIATRRIDGLGFDHGASYLSPDYNFEEVLKNYSLNWETDANGYFLKGGMNALAKTLMSHSRIQKENKLMTIKKNHDQWELTTDKGIEIECQQVIITAPVPQAVELLKQNNIYVAKDLSQVTYSKALVLLMVLKDIPTDGRSVEFENHEFLLMRDRNLHPEGLILKISAHSSEYLFEKSDDFIIDALEVIMKRSPFRDSVILKRELKKWRYSLPLGRVNSSSVEIEKGLFLAGDGFGNPFASAQDVAKKM